MKRPLSTQRGRHQTFCWRDCWSRGILKWNKSRNNSPDNGGFRFNDTPYMQKVKNHRDLPTLSEDER